MLFQHRSFWCHDFKRVEEYWNNKHCMYQSKQWLAVSRSLQMIIRLCYKSLTGRRSAMGTVIIKITTFPKGSMTCSLVKAIHHLFLFGVFLYNDTVCTITRAGNSIYYCGNTVASPSLSEWEKHDNCETDCSNDLLLPVINLSLHLWTNLSWMARVGRTELATLTNLTWALRMPSHVNVFTSL